MVIRIEEQITLKWEAIRILILNVLIGLDNFEAHSYFWECVLRFGESKTFFEYLDTCATNYNLKISKL